jgi:magnesium chelatase family protein
MLGVFFHADIVLCVPLVDFRELSATAPSGESSAIIRERVVAARRIQQERFRKSAHHTNAAMNARQVRQHCQLDAESTGYLEQAMEDMNFSARAHDRILKVARTLSGLWRRRGGGRRSRGDRRGR